MKGPRAMLLLAIILINRQRKRHLVFLVVLLYSLRVASNIPSLCQAAAAVITISSMQLRTFQTPYYVLPRSDACPTMMEHWTDRQWHTRVRMTKALFMELCHLLDPELRGQDSNFRRPTPVQQLQLHSCHHCAWCQLRAPGAAWAGRWAGEKAPHCHCWPAAAPCEPRGALRQARRPL